MVTVRSAVERIGKDEKPFIALELTGDIELVQSQQTGRFYATARHCYIPSTFDQKTAEQFIGKQLPGNIARVESDPYEYTIRDTGEVITLTHSWVYQPEEAPVHETSKKNHMKVASQHQVYDDMLNEM